MQVMWNGVMGDVKLGAGGGDVELGADGVMWMWCRWE